MRVNTDLSHIQVRTHALDAAVRLHAPGDPPDAVLATAETFVSYILDGHREAVAPGDEVARRRVSAG